MSCCYDWEEPACYRATQRVARKPHPCFECRRTIEPGERYEYVSGVWDGRPSSFHTCEACTTLREHVLAEKGCRCWQFGALLEEATESADEAALSRTRFGAAA